MPNWCENKLTVIGSHEDVVAFMAKARGVSQHYQPAEYEKKWEEQRKVQEGDKYVAPEDRLPELEDFSFHALYPIPKEIMSQPYGSAGYNQERIQWGCKWGASGAILKSFIHISEQAVASYEYRTPWSCGDKFLIKVAKDFPDLVIALSYREEYPTRGRMLFKNGELVMDVHENPGNRRSYTKWQNGYYSSHDKWVKELCNEIENDRGSQATEAV